MSALEIRRLKAFGMQIGGDAQRDLNLLKAIDETLEALDIQLERTIQLNQASRQFIQIVEKADGPIHGDVDLVALFDTARDRISAQYTLLISRYNSAINDPNLCDEDCIADAYKTLINEVVELHNNLNCLSWLIGENNADYDKSMDGEFKSAEEMFAAMGL